TLPREKFPTAEAARAVLAKVGFDAIEPARLPVELPEGPDVLILVGRPRPEVREGVIKTIQGMSPQSVVAPNPADPAEIYVSIPKSVYAEGLPQALRHLENIGVEGVAPPPLAFHGHIAAARRDAAIEALDPSIGVQQRTETWERTFAQLGAAKDLDFT